MTMELTGFVPHVLHIMLEYIRNLTILGLAMRLWETNEDRKWNTDQVFEC